MKAQNVKIEIEATDRLSADIVEVRIDLMLTEMALSDRYKLAYDFDGVMLTLIRRGRSVSGYVLAQKYDVRFARRSLVVAILEAKAAATDRK